MNVNFLCSIRNLLCIFRISSFLVQINMRRESIKVFSVACMLRHVMVIGVSFESLTVEIKVNE